MSKNVKSEIIERLKRDILNGKNSSIDEFWNYVEKVGTPLLEEINDDDDNMIVTMIYKHEDYINTISVNGEFFGFDADESSLERIPNTDIWYKTYIIPKDVRSLYFFTINDDDEKDWCDLDLKIDKYNSNKFICPKDDENPNDLALLCEISSVLEMPNAVDKRLIQPRSDSKCGNIELVSFKSDILGDERRVWIYTPYKYSTSAIPYKLAIFLDGWEYINIIRVPQILDNLIANNLIPPICAVFVDNSHNRDKELTCYKPFIDFLAQEILLWTQKNYNVTNLPFETIISGFSAGALSACYAGLIYPDKFGKILGQSGYFSWAPDLEEEGWIIREFSKYESLPLDLYLNIGSFELRWPFVVNSMNAFIDLLNSKKYNVRNSIYTGGHVHTDWQDTIADGLSWLLKK